MFLVFDVETGGLDASRHSLLSIGLVAADLEAIHGELELKVKHDTYQADGIALSVNRIDLASHHAGAIPPGEVIAAIHAFLDSHFPGVKRIDALSHNIAFDREFLLRFCRAHGPEGARLEDRLMPRMCTMAVGIAARDAGYLETSGFGLAKLAESLGIPVSQESLHSALADARLACRVYQGIQARLRSGMRVNS